MNLLEFLITILSSGAIAAIVSTVLQKKNEEETRKFQAKLEAYKTFIGYLESIYTELEHKEINTFTLNKISSGSLLVSDEEINKRVKEFNSIVNKAHLEFSGGRYKEAWDIMKNEAFPLADKIEELMRTDLGFAK